MRKDKMGRFLEWWKAPGRYWEDVPESGHAGAGNPGENGSEERKRSGEKRYVTLLLMRCAALAGTYFLVFALLSFGIKASGMNPEGLSNNQPMWKFVLGLCQESNGSWNRADYDAYLSLPTQEADAAMQIGRAHV